MRLVKCEGEEKNMAVSRFFFILFLLRDGSVSRAR
jgi:hypothetical protein